MPKSLEQQIIEATKLKNWEKLEELTAKLEKREAAKKTQKAKPKAQSEETDTIRKTIGKKTKKVETKPKLRKIVNKDEEAFGINKGNRGEALNEKNRVVEFFDDGSEKRDNKLDKKLQKGVTRCSRREKVEKVLVDCNMCPREHEVYETAVEYIDGQIAPMICVKCAAKGIR